MHAQHLLFYSVELQGLGRYDLTCQAGALNVHVSIRQQFVKTRIISLIHRLLRLRNVPVYSVQIHIAEV